MTNVAAHGAMGMAVPGNGDAHAGHGHDPHLAHHFDTPEQQYQSSKLGMWVFLGTEILMFGGLFCGYSVYRHNHPDVFQYAHQYLNRWLGGTNTLVLITSSLTMAWGVRAAQLGFGKALRLLLMLTILGGYIFLGIKAIEYHSKWDEKVFFGASNRFHRDYKGTLEPEEAAGGLEKAAQHETKVIEARTLSAEPPSSPAPQTAVMTETGIIDPNAGTPDAAKIVPPFVTPRGLAPKIVVQHHDELELSDLDKFERERVYTFFGVYFFMTGLHGVHVVVGMCLIYWVLLRSGGPKQRAWLIPAAPLSMALFIAYLGFVVKSNPMLIWGLIACIPFALWAVIWTGQARHQSDEGEFGPTYFTPVDLVGLYWHLVDLIWIFLFPLLYLIH